jgi:cytokinin dehydrogenase
MQNSASRRRVLQGLIASNIVIGFNLAKREWITSANAAPGFEALPPLEGVLYTDSAARDAAGDDFGHLVHRLPIAVLKPGSVEDVVKMVRFARTHKLQVAARGQGHSTYGQPQVEAGIVVDTSSLNTIHHLDRERAEVDAGVLWSQLLQASLEQQLTPPVLTDYIELSIGGTLTVGGIGGTSHRYGVQVDNVLELWVVTGAGNLETCSRSQNRALFTAVLAGLGQCGIIVRATIGLIRADQNARVFLLFYSDLTAFTSDQRLLITQGRFDYVEGQVVPDASGGWRYMLEAASFYTPPKLPNNTVLLSGLSYTQGTEQIEDKSYFDFANRLAPTIAFLKQSGLWSYPHPWLDLFVPGTAVESFVGDIVANLTLTDTGQGPVLLYPAIANQFKLPLFQVPHEEIVFLFSILRTAPVDASTISRMLADNRAFYERNRALGGYRYPIGAVPFSPADWKQHFHSVWGKLVSAKRRYDPDWLLTPGQGIFSEVDNGAKRV